jgi:type VI secretion system protein ImpH
MAPTNGREGADLLEALRQEPYRFAFFQAVRVLERLSGRDAVGLDAPPDREATRFRAQPALSFPPAEVSKLVPAKADRPHEMVVSFFGLTGPSGVLPQHYTALLLSRIRARDYSLRDCLDLFNHRLISLFHRAWEKYRLPFGFERFRLEGGPDSTDPVTTCIYSLVGFGTDGLRGRLSIPDPAFLYYAGLFAHEPRSALGLEGLLTDYFGLAMRVEQAFPQWLTLVGEDLSHIPDDDHPDGRHVRLGMDLIVGEDVLDGQSKFRVRVGPVGYADFQKFFPDSAGLRALSELTRSYVGPEFEFDVLMLLKPEEMPFCRLQTEGENASWLGWNTWIACEALDRMVDDAVFDVTK